MRLEPVLFGFFTLCWLISIVLVAVGGAADRSLPINLYHLYGLAAFGGWLSGNVYVHRTKRTPKRQRTRTFLVYLMGPPGLLFLLHAATQIRANVPLAPVYALGVYVVFFMVPVSFRRMAEPQD
jgi:hypothetical protein